MTPHDQMKVPKRREGFLRERARELAVKAMNHNCDLNCWTAHNVHDSIEESILQFAEETRKAAIRDCADIADWMIRSNEDSKNRAMLGGRKNVASHRQSDIETSETIRNEILSLLNEPSAKQKKAEDLK